MIGSKSLTLAQSVTVYSPPEVASNRALSVGAAIDVWMLGALLYACITGAALVHSDTADK